MADNRVVIDFTVTGDGGVKIDKITQSVEDLGKKGNESLGRLSRAFDVFAGSLASDLLIGGFNKLTALAGQLFQTFVVDGVKAAIEQQDALNQLSTALSLAGKNAEGAVGKFDAFASRIQSTTKFQDDAVISAGALIESLVRLDENGLERATQAAIDLSAVLGKDLQTTSNLVAKALEGNVGALSKFGIKVEEGRTKAETFENVLSKLEARFGGAAEKQINTFSGALTVLSNSFGETKESIGSAIITNQSLVNVLKLATTFMVQLQGAVDGNKKAISSYVSDGVLLVIDSFSVLVSVAQASVITFLKVENALLNARGALQAFSHIVSLGLGGVKERMLETADEVAKLEAKIESLENGEGPLEAIQVGLQKLRNAALAGLGTTTEQANKSTEAIKGTTTAVEDLTKAEEELIKKGVELAKQGAEKDPRLEFENRQAALDAALEAEKISVEEFELARVAFVEDRINKVSALETQQADILIAENQRLAQESALINESLIQDNQKKLTTILASENLNAKDRTKVTQSVAETSKEIEKQKYAAIGGILTNFSSLQNAKTKELQAIGKAAAIAQTTINTYQAASLALATIPPPFGFIAAAANIAAGLVQVSNIAGVGLAEGITSVPPGFANDTFSARLSSGERVVDKGTNEDLKQMTASWPVVVSLLGGIQDRIGALELKTVVNIGSRTIIDEVRDGVQSGRAINA